MQKISGLRRIFGIGTTIFSCTLGCASIPPSIHEYRLDAEEGVLRGTEPKDDLPLDFCNKEPCYVYSDRDVRSIKKYIVELEDRLDECKK